MWCESFVLRSGLFGHLHAIFYHRFTKFRSIFMDQFGNNKHSDYQQHFFKLPSLSFGHGYRNTEGHIEKTN